MDASQDGLLAGHIIVVTGYNLTYLKLSSKLMVGPNRRTVFKSYSKMLILSPIG